MTLKERPSSSSECDTSYQFHNRCHAHPIPGVICDLTNRECSERLLQLAGSLSSAAAPPLPGATDICDRSVHRLLIMLNEMLENGQVSQSIYLN